MKPDDIVDLRTPGRPGVCADGTVLVAVSSPDLAEDRYRSHLEHLTSASAPRPFTHGPRDSAPVVSPDGHRVAFLRAQQSGPAQLQLMDLRGGEPRAVTDHPLGAGTAVFAPTGTAIAYAAAVPESGRYGTDSDVPAEAEPPRLIDRLSYRRDGTGFTVDRPEQLFLLGLEDGATPTQLTDGRSVVSGPAFLSDGRIVYARLVDQDRPQGELVVLPAEGGADGQVPAEGTVLSRATGNVAQLVGDGDTVYYVGAEFEDYDFAGRSSGLWAVPATGGRPRRLTGDDVEVDAAVAPVAIGSAVLVAVLRRGAVSLMAVSKDADRVPLEALTPVIGGERVVTSFNAVGTTEGFLVATVVAGPGSVGDVALITVDATGRPTGDEQQLTDLAESLRATGFARHESLTATAPDGYPVHGFLVLPDGAGPHPVLLVVHGGPHAAYGWGLFDEAQVYAGAGYAVVLPNPRGSAGYGQDHGRSILGRLGTVDADDVLALLDAALQRDDCDAGRVGVMGGSYGGFMTSWLAAKAPERFTAAISERAVNAWDSFAGSSDIGYYFAAAYTGPDRDTQWRSSPLAYADEIRLPLLIIHSEHDWRCPVEQAQRLYAALKLRAAEVEMLLFPAEGHELSRSGRPRHRLHRFSAILQWWQRHLPVDTAERPVEESTISL